MINVILGGSLIIGCGVAIVFRKLDRFQQEKMLPTVQDEDDIAGLIAPTKHAEQHIEGHYWNEGTADGVARTARKVAFKGGREDLIGRYQRDHDVLSKQIHAQQQALGVAWRTLVYWI